MSFAPCLLIPVYNHGSSMPATVERLAAYGLAIYVVDDGSDAATQAVLERLAADCPLLRLYRLPPQSRQGRGGDARYARGVQGRFQPCAAD